MKKALSVILALVMALSLSIPAFAAENDKSGSTTIMATKAEPELAYTIVIPTATTLDDEKHANVQLGGEEGVASITVTTGNSKTNVYYTVDLTNATLTDGTNTITTTYAYAQGGDYSALTGDTKVTVYEGGTVKDSTIQVTADDTAWAAAPAGTYTASVVFNFVAEEVDTSITYMDWDSENKKLVEKPVPNDAIEVTSETTTLEEGKFYIVKGEVSTGTLTVSGTTAQPTTLILMDDAKLTVTGTDKNAGINVASDKALIITAPKDGTGELTATGGQYGAGIGGGSNGVGGTVNINGGTVTANGGQYGAGIGGGGGSSGGDVNINGGTVTATGSSDGGAGIGGGAFGLANSGTINFGEGVNFTVYAGAAAPGSETTTTDYASNHSAKYVKIEETPGSV